MQEKALFSDAFLRQPPLIKRLFVEFIESSREFRHSPKAYLAAAFRDDSLGSHRRKELLRFGMAIGVLVFSTAFFFVVVFPQLFGTAQAQDPYEQAKQLEDVPDIEDLADAVKIEAVKADTHAGGGGGGGRQMEQPVSRGDLPPASLLESPVTPTTMPLPRPPALPVPATMQVQPELVPQTNFGNIGMPNALPGPPSDGPGTGGGFGTGSGGGVGSGDGTGLGPGHGMNTGGGGTEFGGGDRNPDGSARVVDSKPILIYQVRPNYTEEARKNKTQGVIRLRVLVGADGSVKNVQLRSHLPDGLDEQAIAAGYKLRFKPAMKGGQPVAYWVPVESEFTLR